MALETEDGTGKADAESYASVAEADLYFSNRGYTLWATLTTEEREQALRRATDYMGEVYRLRWTGTRLTSTQALDWPRYLVPMVDSPGGYGVLPAYYPQDEVPVLVKSACCYLAFKASQGELAPDLDRRTTREKVDVIEVEYSDRGPQFVVYRAADNMLKPFLSGNGGSMMKVVRA